MGHADVTDVDAFVDGQLLEEFSGLDDWAPGNEASHNEGPGGRAYGFNTQKGNNKVTFSIKVRDTSRSLAILHALVKTQKIVTVKAAVVRNLDAYEVGQEIGLGCERGILSGGTRSKGSAEASDVSFSVVGIGPLTELKSA